MPPFPTTPLPWALLRPSPGPGAASDAPSSCSPPSSPPSRRPIPREPCGRRDVFCEWGGGCPGGSTGRAGGAPASPPRKHLVWGTLRHSRGPGWGRGCEPPRPRTRVEGALWRLSWALGPKPRHGQVESERETQAPRRFRATGVSAPEAPLRRGRAPHVFSPRARLRSGREPPLWVGPWVIRCGLRGRAGSLASASGSMESPSPILGAPAPLPQIKSGIHSFPTSLDR